MKRKYESPQLDLYAFEAARGYAASGVTASVADFDRQPWSAPAPDPNEPR